MRRVTYALLLLFVFCASTAKATERFVPADFGTIQAAIDAAAVGDVIQVAAGTYAENITINKSVILRGIGQTLADTVIQGQLTITGSGANAGFPLEVRDLRIQPTVFGAGVFFSTAVSNILLRDITSTTAAGNDGHYAIHVQGGSNITNLRLEGVTTSYSLGGFRVATTGIVNGLSIRNCDFSNNVHGMLVYASNGVPDNATTFNNVHIYKTRFFNNKLKGIYSEKFNNTTVSQCTFDSNAVHAGHWSAYTDGGAPWSSSFDLNLKYGSYSNFKLVGNHFVNNGAGADADKGAAALIKARDDGGSYGPHPASLAGIEASGNTFVNNSYMDLRFGETTKLNAGMSGALVRNNSFVGSTQNIGIDNHATLAIDAQENFWNAADGSSANGGSGAGVNVFAGAGAVDSSNHLSAGDGDATEVGFQMTRYVDDDWAAVLAGNDPDGVGPANAMGRDAFASISDALAVVLPGDRIYVYDGSYAHFQVLIGRDNVTIEGESRAGVRIVPAIVDTKEENPQAGTVVLGFIVGADDVTISSLTIDGEGNNAGLAQGATDNNFRIGVVNNPATLSHGTEILNCDVLGCVYDGIAIGTFNPLLGKSLQMKVEGCNVDDVTLGHGISFSGEGEVIDNTINDIGSVALASGFRGTGIQLEGGPITVTGNTITNFSNLGIGNNASTFAAPHVYTIQDNSISQIQNGNFAQGDFGIRIVSADGGTKIGGRGAGEGNTIDLSDNDTSLRRWGIVLSYSNDQMVGDVEVSGNNITMGGEGTGILLHHNNISSNPILLAQNEISSSNPMSGGFWQGIGILVNDDGDMFFDGYDEDAQNYVVLDGNDVSGFTVGVSVQAIGTDPAGGRLQQVTMRNNNVLSSNSVGLNIRDANGPVTGYRAIVTVERSGLEADANAIGVNVDGSQASFDQVSVTNNTMTGMVIANLAHVTSLIDSEISGNATGVVLSSLVPPGAFTGNDFSNSSMFGLNNTGGNVIDASNSYWGDVSGPMHASNPAGLGAAVSDDVTFLPFDGFDPIEPSLDSTPGTSIDVLDMYSHTILFSGNPLPTISVVGLPAWLAYDVPSQMISGTPALGDAGLSSEIEIRAASGFGPDAIQRFQISVVAIAPTITSSAPTAVNVGVAYSYAITANGTPDATITVMGLPAWLSYNALTQTISGTPAFGDIGMTGMITIGAANGVAPDASQTFQITVSGVAPTITSVAPTTVLVGGSYSYAITASGTPAASVTVLGLPAWLSYNALTQTISGTPSALDFGLSGVITVTANNLVLPNATQNFQIDVSGIAATITTAAQQLALAGEEYRYVIAAVGTPTPTLSVIGLPGWLTFDAPTSTLVGTPAIADAGMSGLITIRAANGVGIDATQIFTISVQIEEPLVVSQPSQEAIVGEEYVYIVQVSGTPRPTITVTGLPSWMTFDGVSRISGIPPAAHGARATIMISVQNMVGDPVLQSFDVVIINPLHRDSDDGGSCSLAEGDSNLIWLLACLSFFGLWRRRKLACESAGE